MDVRMQQYETLRKVYNCLEKLLYYTEKNIFTEEIVSTLVGMKDFVEMIEKCVTQEEYEGCKEFFDSFTEFCGHCQEEIFVRSNMEILNDSLQVMVECTSHLLKKREHMLRKCNICKRDVFYNPLPEYYVDMERRYNVTWHRAETLNRAEYMCPECGATDRDRLVISYLQKLELQYAGRREPIKILQIAPSRVIEDWIRENCPNVVYHSTDLYMDNVTFSSDIQNMHEIADATYDIVICSHVLEHVPDDCQAMRELKRILTKDGICLFLVPVFLDAGQIDEAWGLSEEENWRRFGQGDHCRVYSKEGLLERLKGSGFEVHEMGKEVLGDSIFREAGLTDTSTLYVLGKTECTDSELENQQKNKWETDDIEQPLVSVIMSVYNHEAFVEEAIESVINQTYKNIEFIVADDGSSDGSAEILKRYEPYFKKVYYNKENRGGCQENLVLEATGKYTAMMNSDDIWELDKIEKQVRILQSNSAYGACFTWCDYVDEGLNIIENPTFYQKNRPKEAWMKHMLLYGNCFCHPSILIETKMYQRLLNSGEGAFRQLPDFWMWLQLLQENEIYVLPESLVKMRRFEGKSGTNTSAVNTVNMCRDMTESIYIWYTVVKNMQMKYFKEAFSKEFLYINAETKEELLCEKFFLLKSVGRKVTDMAAILFYFDIYQMESVVECLNSRYHFGKKEFWEYYGESGILRFITSV